MHIIATRWQIPSPPLRASVLSTGALGFLGVTGAALLARPWLQLGVMYPGKAAAFFAAVMVLAAGLIGAHHPFPRFGPANQVTMMRAMLLALLASLIGESELPHVAAGATAIAVIMTLLDGVDGWLARCSRMASEFGARFDTETDAMLVMAMSVLVWQHGKAGVWVLLGGLMRYTFIAAGWKLDWMARSLQPTRRGRVIAICHTVGLIVALAPIIPVPLSASAVAVTLMVLAWSFAVDVGRLWRKE